MAPGIGQDTILDPIYKIPVLGKNEEPAALITQNIFVQVGLSSKTIYVGEPVLVTYKLFTALNSQSRVTQQPSFSGCSVHDLPIDKEPDEATYNGKRYHVFVIRKVQLIPFAPGELILGQAMVNNIVAISHSGNLLETENYSAVTSNQPQSITVKPLPDKPLTKMNRALVGTYSIHAQVDADSISVGESATLKIRITGAGNIQGIPLPEIHWPTSIEHFEGTDTEQTDEYVFPIQGYKQFEIPFIGKSVGTTFIPPIRVSFFDPTTASFQEMQTDTIPLLFTKAVVNAGLPIVQKNNSTNFPTYLWLLPFLLLMASWIILIRRNKYKKKSKEKILANEKRVEKGVQEHVAAPDDLFLQLNKLTGIELDSTYFHFAKKILVQALQRKTGLDTSTESTLVQALEGLPDAGKWSPSCHTILEACNRQLFAMGENKEVREKVYFELVALLKNFQSEN